MLSIETQYGNFGSSEDLLKFMKEEGIEKVNITVKYVFDAVIFGEMTITDVEKWNQMNKKGR